MFYNNADAALTARTYPFNPPPPKLWIINKKKLTSVMELYDIQSYV